MAISRIYLTAYYAIAHEGMYSCNTRDLGSTTGSWRRRRWFYCPSMRQHNLQNPGNRYTHTRRNQLAPYQLSTPSVVDCCQKGPDPEVHNCLTSIGLISFQKWKCTWRREVFLLATTLNSSTKLEQLRSDGYFDNSYHSLNRCSR